MYEKCEMSKRIAIEQVGRGERKRGIEEKDFLIQDQKVSVGFHRQMKWKEFSRKKAILAG